MDSGNNQRKQEDGEMKNSAAAKPKTEEGGTLVAMVPGSNGKQYQIRHHGGTQWTCSCMAYRFTRGEVGKKEFCKHLTAVVVGSMVEAQ
jgi:hypothetical protein